MNLFLGMIKREITDDELLEESDDAAALKIFLICPLVKCAVLSWHTLGESLE